MLKQNNHTFLELNLNTFDHFDIIKTSSGFLFSFSCKGSSFFVKLPSCISYEIKENLLLFSLYDTKYMGLIKTFQNIFKQIDSKRLTFRRKLVMNGLGFKVYSTNDIINFKLGYSHLISLKVPVCVSRLLLRKKRVTIETEDKIASGNFINKIYNLRKYDNYKGKGFAFAYAKKRIKTVKKK